MKISIVGAFGMAAIGVFAQGDTLTVTEFYSSCSTASPIYTSTVTGTITQTYCPSCTAEAAKAVPSDVILTTYTTTYTQVCSTGLTAQVYTVTAPCSTPGLPLPKDYVPPSFTVTTVSCPVCPTPGPVVVTTPIAGPTSPATPIAGPPDSAGPGPAPTGGVSAIPPASAGPGALPAVPSLPSSPKLLPGGPVGGYGSGNGSSPASSGRAAAGTSAPTLPKFTSAAKALGRNVGIVGLVSFVVGGFYICL